MNFTELNGSLVTLKDSVTFQPADSSTQISASIFLRKKTHPNGMNLLQYADAVMEGKCPTLSIDELSLYFGVYPNDVDKVLEYLRNQGITNIQFDSTIGSIKITSNVNSINDAFNVTILNITDGDRNYISYQGFLSIPDEFNKIITSVTGLDKSLQFKPALVPASPANNPGGLQPITPVQAATAYRMLGTSRYADNGLGQTIAIVQQTGGYSQSDIVQSFNQLNLPVPNLIYKSKDLPTNPGSFPVTDFKIETILDIYVAGGISPGATIVTYNEDDVFSSISEAIFDTEYSPKIISISYAVQESALSAGQLSAYESTLAGAVSTGIVLFAANGDWGSRDTGQQSVGVNYPASSRYVVAVGGTTLELNDNNSIKNEYVWNNFPYQSTGSGGGVSAQIAVPPYQTGLTFKAWPSGTVSSLTGRGVADVAANSDGNSGYQFYINGILSPSPIGGTSAAAPLWAGLLARLRALTGKTVTPFHNIIYGNTSAFNDITVGNNVVYSGDTGYAATAGWDAITGLGSPDGTKLYNAIGGRPKSKVIEREFVLQRGDDTLPAVTLDYAWSSFMNTYAVWPAGTGDTVTIRRTIELQKGYYYITGAVDNYGSVNINGQYNINLYNFDANISRTTIGNNTRIYHGGGDMIIVISATNTGGPRGVAVTISKELVTISNQLSYNHFNARETYSIGDLVWSTRTPGTATVARYQIIMPFRAQITAHTWGAGGGGGGNDAGTVGGVGAPGLYNTTSFIVERGDLLEVFLGSGGTGGINGRGYQPGGRSGSSRIDINGSSVTSFNGGVGGNIIGGKKASSGSGGGGGGASGVLVNNVPAIVAGGGGGGGGAGNDGNSSSNYSRRDAVIANNANSATGSDFRGENGQDKSGDGGGGGGGGGGYPGGQGGSTPGGDISAYAGQCGGNFPVLAATAGLSTPYYKAGYASGGDRSGGTGQNGRVILLIEPLSLMSVKVSNEWKQINECFVKVGGSWRDIDTVYIKIDDAWREVNGSGQGDVTLAGNTQNYGTSTRSYT